MYTIVKTFYYGKWQRARDVPALHAQQLGIVCWDRLQALSLESSTEQEHADQVWEDVRKRVSEEVCVLLKTTYLECKENWNQFQLAHSWWEQRQVEAKQIHHSVSACFTSTSTTVSTTTLFSLPPPPVNRARLYLDKRRMKRYWYEQVLAKRSVLEADLETCRDLIQSFPQSMNQYRDETSEHGTVSFSQLAETLVMDARASLLSRTYTERYQEWNLVSWIYEELICKLIPF